MKVLIPIPAVGLVLTLLAWFLFFKPGPQTRASTQPQPTPTPDDSAAFYAESEALLFADDSLEALLRNIESNKEVLKHPPPFANQPLKEVLKHFKNRPPVVRRTIHFHCGLRVGEPAQAQRYAADPSGAARSKR